MLNLYSNNITGGLNGKIRLDCFVILFVSISSHEILFEFKVKILDLVLD